LILKQNEAKGSLTDTCNNQYYSNMCLLLELKMHFLLSLKKSDYKPLNIEY